MKMSLIWVAVLVFACCVAQAQNNTRQSINDVLEQSAGMEMKLSSQISVEEDVPT